MANGLPHTHELCVRRRYGYSSSGPWVVTYGDQTADVKPWWAIVGPYLGDAEPTKRRVQRAVRRVIRNHDKASMRYEQRSAAEKTAQQVIAEANLNLRPGTWASAHKKERDQISATTREGIA